MATVEFVSYDGVWPSLCGGTLILKINGEEVTLKPGCLCSGGGVWFDENAEDYVWNQAPWTLDLDLLPDKLKPYQKEIEACVNENIPWGCCGGCS